MLHTVCVATLAYDTLHRSMSTYHARLSAYSQPNSGKQMSRLLTCSQRVSTIAVRLVYDYYTETERLFPSVDYGIIVQTDRAVHMLHVPVVCPFSEKDH